MAWARLDDRFPDHPKVIGLSDAGFRLHVRALCYTAQYFTNGRIPRAFCPDHAAVELVEAGLWEPDEPTGHRIHDYSDFNPDHEELLVRREAIGRARASAGARGGLKSGEVRRSKREASLEANAKQNGTPVPVPVPVKSIHPPPEDAVEALESTSPSTKATAPAPVQLRGQQELVDAPVFVVFPAKDRKSRRHTMAEVYPGYVEELQAAFVEVDAAVEVRAAAEWATAFPAKAKVNVNQFLRGWLRRSQTHKSLRKGWATGAKP